MKEHPYRYCCRLTKLRRGEKGRPRSRANDHVIREAAARHPIALQNSSKIMMLTMMVAPADDPTASRKIRMNGESTESSIRRFSMSCALNNTARSIPTASVPLMARLMSIERGTSVLAFLTSSDIYTDQQDHCIPAHRLTCTTESVPMKASAFPCRPTKKASACVSH
jgi:hypothetical protein